ncbi:hypothetical protein B5V00_14675 [Geothermobacter hydrogeniphilus]|uniref:ADP-ribosylglycohydrolase n=2 Tax=Geothermobacter hydrogeniphilus TaxID=1969733 RepID=A0A1X0XSS1_9BACT|nr:hypothetical protein B5V00_14675 [Geothermobacter hydrogeniphilus]
MVRRAQPGAVETPEQKDFILRYRPWVGRQAFGHFHGCLLGGAVGDALGWPIEFSSLETIRSVYGAEGITAPVANTRGRVEISDDTQMALFTAEGLLHGHVEWCAGRKDAITRQAHRAYLRWLHAQGEELPEGSRDYLIGGHLLRYPEMFAVRAPGGTCITALKSGRVGTMEERINDSKGCGTVMRVAPVGLFAASPELLSTLAEDESNETAFRLGCEISAITHGHPTGWLAGGYLALLISRAIMGDSLDKATAVADAELLRWPEHEECVTAIRKAWRIYGETGNTPGPEAIARIGEGWVAEEALAIALYCALCYRDHFEKAVLLSVNHGGDSDSTGAITGNIMGALLGDRAIPREWTKGLELEGCIGKMAGRLFVGP